MAEFTIGEHDYASKKIAPLRGVHVLRRVLPFLPMLGYFIPVQTMLGQLADDLKEGRAKAGEKIPLEMVDAVVEGATPTLQMLARMTDADVDYVFEACLSAT